MASRLRSGTPQATCREPIVKANNRQAIEYIVQEMRQQLRVVPSTQVDEVILPTGSAAAPEANVFA